MKYHIPNQMTIDTMIFFIDHVDLRRYIAQIRLVFWKFCSKNLIEYLDKFIKLGFELQELSEAFDNRDYQQTVWYYVLQTNNTDIIKFLLSHNVDFKKHELAIMRQCISYRRLDYIKLFVEHGGDYCVLNEYAIDNFKKNNVDLYKTLVQNGVDPMHATLFLIEN